MDEEGDVKLDASRSCVDEEKGHVSTSTSEGVINLWHEDDASDEWFSYTEITEYILCPCERTADRVDDEAGAGDKQNSIPMRPSLFPHVSPYIMFHSFDCECPRLPPDIGKHLRWKLNTVTPRIITRTLVNSGFRLMTRSEDWSGVWSPPLAEPVHFRQIRSFQKVNSFPGSYHLGYKDHLWRHLNRMRLRFGTEEFGFMPRTYVLPRDFHRFRIVWQKNAGAKWIVKPPCSGRGQGVRVINQWWEIPKWHSTVVQRYISKPKLINGTKFDLRVYVLVTSINPMRIYLYTEGLVRFASVKYVHDSTNLNDRCMHLTNTSINKLSPTYIFNNSVDSTRGHKWSFRTLWAYLANKEHVDVPSLQREIRDIVVKTLISAEDAMNTAIQGNLSSTYTCYELYGFDIILDEGNKPWLLEVNILPSLHTDSRLDVAIKGPLVRNVLNVANYHIPNTLSLFEERQLARRYRATQMRQDYRMYATTLSARERNKQTSFGTTENRAEYVESILEVLTRDDIRHLVRYEDELTQLEMFEKIFPTCDTHKYFEYYETSRYYNKLFDAWEYRYGEERDKGVERLRNLCEKRLHLEPVID